MAHQAVCKDSVPLGVGREAQAAEAGARQVFGGGAAEGHRRAAHTWLLGHVHQAVAAGVVAHGLRAPVARRIAVCHRAGRGAATLCVAGPRLAAALPGRAAAALTLGMLLSIGLACAGSAAAATTIIATWRLRRPSAALFQTANKHDMGTSHQEHKWKIFCRTLACTEGFVTKRGARTPAGRLGRSSAHELAWRCKLEQRWRF